MGNFKDKSENSLDAAEFLHGGRYYSSVAHCAYYSCFQLMKHIWFISMKKTNSDLRKINIKSQEGSHDVLINQIILLVKQKSLNDRVFYTEIIKLKRLRVISDYNDTYINLSQSAESIRLSKSIQQILNKCL